MMSQCEYQAAMNLICLNRWKNGETFRLPLWSTIPFAYLRSLAKNWGGTIGTGWSRANTRRMNIAIQTTFAKDAPS